MSNVIQLPVIAGVEITTDAEGRFNLNALHKASKLGDGKKPRKWLRTDTAAALIDELEDHISPAKPINTVKGRGITGSFAHELIAISYAGWISPAFQLKVNRVFLDYRTGKLQPTIPQTFPEALRLAAELVGENEKMKPKVAAYDRIAFSDGMLNLTNTAKNLQLQPQKIIQWLRQNNWIYRRPGGSNNVACQKKIQAGYMTHKVTTILRDNGTEKVCEQAMFTPKGLTKLSEIFSDADVAWIAPGSVKALRCGSPTIFIKTPCNP